MSREPCPFCDLEGSTRVFYEGELVFGLWDGYPVSEGHSLVVPRRHIVSLFDGTAEEQQAVWEAVAWVREDLARQFRPDGFTIGLNDGRAAGQTVMHAHVHVIPRHVGDVTDPRGGIRHVIAEKACYWTAEPQLDDEAQP